MTRLVVLLSALALVAAYLLGVGVIKIAAMV
jgi:hypothetical protein